MKNKIDQLTQQLQDSIKQATSWTVNVDFLVEAMELVITGTPIKVEAATTYLNTLPNTTFIEWDKDEDNFWGAIFKVEVV